MSKICGLMHYTKKFDSGDSVDMVRISFSDDIPKDKGKGFNVDAVVCSLKRFTSCGLSDDLPMGKECLILYDRFGKFCGVQFKE